MSREKNKKICFKNIKIPRGTFMPILSYLVYPREGKKERLIRSLQKISSCEILESTNEDILILLTDTKDDYEEGLIQENLKQVPEIEGMALVYAQEG